MIIRLIIAIKWQFYLYNKEVQRAIKTFTALLEPILIVVLGLGVALLAMSVIQPIYGVLQTI